MKSVKLIAFDADDTLWQNEKYYVEVQNKFSQLLAQYHNSEWIQERLFQTEMRNLQHFGYGVKAFTLSMIETAIELTEGRISGSEILILIEEAKRMLNNRIELLEDVDWVIPQLSQNYSLMLITKGDLLDQEAKLARSGLQSYFQYVEIVSHKNQETYQRLQKRYQVEPGQFLMVGNSLRSDILPVLELGSTGVHIPYSLTWSHENAEPPAVGTAGYFRLDRLAELPDLLKQINPH